MSGRTSTLTIKWTRIFGANSIIPRAHQEVNSKIKKKWMEVFTPILNCYYFLFNSLSHLSSSFSILSILSMTSLSLRWLLFAIANSSFILLFNVLTQTSYCLSNSCAFISFFLSFSLSFLHLHYITNERKVNTFLNFFLNKIKLISLLTKGLQSSKMVGHALTRHQSQVKARMKKSSARLSIR